MLPPPLARRLAFRRCSLAVSELAPGVLIAVPQMEDPNFERSVVLMLEHTAGGAMGIVVNRPSEIAIADIAKAHGFRAAPGSGTAFIGGPVDRQRGFLLHKRGDVPDALKVVEGVYLSVSAASLPALLGASTDGVRLCLGYAGWGAGQLEREVMVGGWLTSAATPLRIFDTPIEKMWDAVIRDLGVDPAFLVQGGGPQ